TLFPYTTLFRSTFPAIIKVHDLPVDRTRWGSRIAAALFAGRSGAGNERQRISDRHNVRERFGLFHNRNSGAAVHEHAADARIKGSVDCRVLWWIHNFLDIQR